MKKIENENVVVVEVKKEMNVEELSKIVNVSSGSIRVWVNKVEIGKVYDGSLNVKYCIKKLIERLGSKKILDEKLGFNSDELVLVKNSKESKVYVDYKKLIVGKKYLIWNYGFCKERILEDIIESNKYGKVWLFSGSNSKNDKILDCYIKDDWKKESIKIEEF